MLDHKLSIPEGLSEEELTMVLDPLGYDAIKDIDEIHSRNRRKTDNPLIYPTSEKIAYHFPKIEDEERR
ncbi:uncharacterized protein METZ01_LOCUS298787 [marine metagenome]|uniref:Uncharacterized protein n=1 Tax=marine metagenome TaxID=408172 RepID=A0A382MAA7_9ZZZZ